MAVSITRDQVLGYRVRAQQLDRDAGSVADTAALDLGVQDTGPDGALWALAIRGVDVASVPASELAMEWTLRGAPHLYRRADLPSIAQAVAPFSDADAGKRIFDATKPLKAAGIGNLEALDAVAAAMRSVVTEPMVKGDVSTQVTVLMDPPYLRFCRSCDATHLYEQPFRLAAFRAGLELQPGTSPPVLQPIPDFAPVEAGTTGTAGEGADAALRSFDVIRAYLRLFGPATPKHVADFVDANLRDVKARWPADAVEVSLDGETRWVLATDVDALDAGPTHSSPLRPQLNRPARTTRLLGPYDLFLQAKDRSLLVDDAARAKTLWPVLGRPGAVLVDGEIAGTWRPRTSGKKLKLMVELWERDSSAVRDAVTEQAERLAGYRQVSLSGLDFAD